MNFPKYEAEFVNETRYIYWYTVINKQFVFLSPFKKDNKLRKLTAIIKLIKTNKDENI